MRRSEVYSQFVGDSPEWGLVQSFVGKLLVERPMLWFLVIYEK
jgi:hypothetical protein